MHYAVYSVHVKTKNFYRVIHSEFLDNFREYLYPELDRSGPMIISLTFWYDNKFVRLGDDSRDIIKYKCIFSINARLDFRLWSLHLFTLERPQSEKLKKAVS